MLAHLARQCWKPFRAASDTTLHARVIGKPVPPRHQRRGAAAERFAGRTGPVRILVIGGSQVRRG